MAHMAGDEKLVAKHDDHDTITVQVGVDQVLLCWVSAAQSHR